MTIIEKIAVGVGSGVVIFLGVFIWGLVDALFSLIAGAFLEVFQLPFKKSLRKKKTKEEKKDEKNI